MLFSYYRVVPKISILRNLTMSSKIIEEAKKSAAEKAITTWFEKLPKNRVYHIGIGSGSTIVYAVAKLSELVKRTQLQIDCVPSSFQARQLICENNLKLTSLDTCPDLDLVIDGADEVDEHFNMIKGGGGCLLQEKILIHFSKINIILVDYTKISKRLGDKWKKGVPIEVISHAILPVSRRIEELFGGQCHLRMAVRKAGPVVTDNGNLLIDWEAPDGDHCWEVINSKLNNIPGVIQTGLFVNYDPVVYVGCENGDVKELNMGSKFQKFAQ